MTDSSKNETTTLEVEVEIRVVDVRTVQTSRSTETSNSKARFSDLMEIVPVVLEVAAKMADVDRFILVVLEVAAKTADVDRFIPVVREAEGKTGNVDRFIPVVLEVAGKTENVDHFTGGINHSTETNVKGKRSGSAEIRVRETDSAEDRRIDDSHMVKKGGRILTKTKEEEANGSHLTKVKRMAMAENGEISHVARTNITTKSRSKIWTTCLRRNRRS